MANNYIIYPYGDKDAPLWHNTGITIINQEPVSAGEIATAFSSDDWTDIDGSGSDFTNFGINEDDSISTSYWVVLNIHLLITLLLDSLMQGQLMMLLRLLLQQVHMIM